MAVIGATQLEPVNILGSYVQGLEGGRAARAQRLQEQAALAQAQRETELRNFLSTADLGTPEAQNRLLRFGKPGAEIAASLADIEGKRATAEKVGLEARGLSAKLADDNYGRFQKMLGDLAYGEAPPTKAQVLDQVEFLIAQGSIVPQFREFAASSLPDDPAQLQAALRGQFLSQIPPAERAKLFVPMSASVLAQQKELKATGAPRTTIQMPPSESERGKVLGRLGGEALVAEYNAAQAASKGLSKDYEALKLLREGKPATGITSELETTFNRFRADVAGDKEAAAKVSDSQFLEALLGSDVFSQIAALGVGARGLDTPAEREFLREVISGTRKLDKDTLIRMAELRAKYKEEAVDAYNERIRSGELDEFFRDFGRPKREFAKPERPKAPDQPEVVRAPDGKVFTFPNKAAADKFRKEAGL